MNFQLHYYCVCIGFSPEMLLVCPVHSMWLYFMMQNTQNRLQIVFIELCSISITEMQTTNGINSQLSITHSDRQDSGVYKCVAENPFGKSEHVIYVAVQGMYEFLPISLFHIRSMFMGVVYLCEYECECVCVYKALYKL